MFILKLLAEATPFWMSINTGHSATWNGQVLFSDWEMALELIGSYKYADGDVMFLTRFGPPAKNWVHRRLPYTPLMWLPWPYRFYLHFALYRIVSSFWCYSRGPQKWGDRRSCRKKKRCCSPELHPSWVYVQTKGWLYQIFYAKTTTMTKGSNQ